MSKKNRRILGLPGPPCRRSGQLTQVREHERISEKMRHQPFFFRRWYRCMNENCHTKEIMPEQFIIWNNNKAARRLRAKRREEAPPEQVIITPARYRGDIALEVLDDMARAGGARPPWE